MRWNKWCYKLLLHPKKLSLVSGNGDIGDKAHGGSLMGDPIGFTAAASLPGSCTEVSALTSCRWAALMGLEDVRI